MSLQLAFKFSSLSPLFPLSILFVILCTSCKHLDTFLERTKDCGDNNFSCADMHELMKKCWCQQPLSQEIIGDGLFFDLAFHISSIINLSFYSAKIYWVPATHKILSKTLINKINKKWPLHLNDQISNEDNRYLKMGKVQW